MGLLNVYIFQVDSWFTRAETPSKKLLISMDKFFYGAFIIQFFVMLFLKALPFPEVDQCRDDETLSFKNYWELCTNHWNKMRNDNDDDRVPVLHKLLVFPSHFIIYD